MEKKDKPLSEWTLKEVQELCDNQDDCPGCPFYTAENGCMFSGEAASWPLEASEAMTTPSAEESSAPDKPAKPRLAVLWNVEVGEPFTIVHEGREFTDLTLSQEGYVFGDVPVYVIFDAINDPARVHKQVRLTEQELELCRMFEVKYLTRNVNSWCVHMWHTRPSENEGGMGKYYAIDIREASEIGAVDARFFPSIEPGDCICVEETVE